MTLDNKQTANQNRISMSYALKNPTKLWQEIKRHIFLGMFRPVFPNLVNLRFVDF